MGAIIVNFPYAVVPAFDLNLTSVIFASAAAPAASSRAVEITDKDDTMTFRWADRQNKIKSKATWNEDGIKLTKKGNGDNDYLCVQGKNGEKDWIWSEKVTDVADTNPITAQTIAGNIEKQFSISNLAVDLSKCKIWLETTDATDGLTYAKQARKLARPATTTQFATVEQLKTFDTDDNTNGPNPAKVYFGANNQQWWIAGEENGNIVLFAASPLATEIPFNVDTGSKIYMEEWGCAYPVGSTINTVNANHYGGSDIRNGNQNGLAGLLTSHFTEAERSRMNDTTVYTQDTANTGSGQPLKYSTTDKLYLAYSAGSGLGYQHIMVGANSDTDLDSGLRVDMTYWGDNGRFWLRAPDPSHGISALAAWPGTCVGTDDVSLPYAVVPAFNFNLTSVLFASAAPAATGEGGQLETEDVTGDGAFTLRYESNTIGTATLSKTKQSVSISGIPGNPEADTYLVAQNSEGAWAKKVSNGDVIFADEMYSDLVSFENCKVWLETTDSGARITSAKMAEESTADTYTVKIKAGQKMTLTGNSVQTVNRNSGITEVTAEVTDPAKADCHIPKNYSSEVVDGISVARDGTEPHFKLKVSGTPNDDVLIDLPEPEEHASKTAENKPSYFKQAVCDTCSKEYGAKTSDNILPTGSVKVGGGEDHTWTDFQSNIRFDYYNGQQTVEITVADDSTEAAGYDETKHAPKAYYYTASEEMTLDQVRGIKEGDWKLYTEKFTLTENSKSIVYVKLVDWSENTEYISSRGIGIDGTPDAPAVDTNGYTSGSWTAGNVKINLTGPDAVSGIKKYQYSTDNGSTWKDVGWADSSQPKKGELTINTDTGKNGTSYIFRAVTNTDKEGMKTEAITVKRDTVEPTGDIFIKENSIKKLLNQITFGRFFKETVDVEITCEDDLSGINKKWYYRSDQVLSEREINELEESKWTEYSQKISETAEDAEKFESTGSRRKHPSVWLRRRCI